MRTKLFVSALVFCCSITFVTGQKAISFTIKPGEKIESTVPDSINYSYPSFINGTVYFRDNRRVTARLNYSSLFEEIMFITPRGDTMALDNGAAINYVVIGVDTFYFDNFFVKNEGSFGDIKLASKDIFSIVDVNAVGAMGNNAPSSVTTVKTLLTRGESRELTRQEILKIRKETRYYAGDRFNNFKMVNRKNLLDLFPGKSKQAKEYLKNNSVSFDNKEELSKMITFLQAK
jgi:hypothetical protein